MVRRRFSIDYSGIDAGCIVCGQKVVMTDSAGMTWCEGHQDRGEMMNKAAQYGYPVVDAEALIVGQGGPVWAVHAAFAKDEQIALVLVFLEAMDVEEAS